MDLIRNTLEVDCRVEDLKQVFRLGQRNRANNDRQTNIRPILIEFRDNSDAASWGTCNELLINGLLGRISKDGVDMNGDLFLKIGVDDVRALGCNDLSDQTGFSLLLGTYQNQIHYERQDATY